MGDVIRVGNNIFSEAAILVVTAELRFSTNRLPSRQAILAMTARRVEPGHSDPITFLYRRHARSEGDDPSDALMAGNEWQRGFQRPVAVPGMDIRVTDAARLGLDQDLARSRIWNIPFLKHQRLSELLHHGRIHFVLH